MFLPTLIRFHADASKIGMSKRLLYVVFSPYYKKVLHFPIFPPWVRMLDVRSSHYKRRTFLWDVFKIGISKRILYGGMCPTLTRCRHDGSFLGMLGADTRAMGRFSGSCMVRALGKTPSLPLPPYLALWEEEFIHHISP